MNENAIDAPIQNENKATAKNDFPKYADNKEDEIQVLSDDDNRSGDFILKNEDEDKNSNEMNYEAESPFHQQSLSQ